MIDAQIRLKVPPEKRKELLQTLKGMLGKIRLEPGCLGCNCYVDLEAEDSLLFIAEWTTSADLEAHLRSIHFAVLAGAMKLLNQEPEIRFHSIAATAGAEMVSAVRG